MGWGLLAALVGFEPTVFPNKGVLYLAKLQHPLSAPKTYWLIMKGGRPAGNGAAGIAGAL